jgi:acetyl esterase/lipase
MRLMGKLPEEILVEKVSIDKLNAEWVYTAEANEGKVILYLHGGGYVTGSAGTHRMLCASLTQKVKAKIFFPEYRLAPEYPFPAALEDATSAYRWLLAQGFEAENIVIAGDSAGGGLSLATIQALRDDNKPLPAGMICISPWTDLTMSYESHRSKANVEPILRADSLELWASSYAADTDLRNPLISPAFADFSGFPSMLIQVGSEEVLLDDAKELAKKAKFAGVDVTLSIYEGMWHVWHAAGEFLPESRAAFEVIGEFVQGVWKE